MVEGLAALRAIAEAANQGEWEAGCFASGSEGCQCKYVFCGGYMGSVATISMDNGRAISDGGNDSPSEDEARANLIHIATFDPPTVLKLLDMIEAKRND